MLRLPCALVLLLAALSFPLAAGDASLAAGDGTPRAALIVTLKDTSRVRFGPSLQAGIACILKRGSEVEVLSRSQVPDWFVVRFPTQGKVWVHQKNLQQLDGGKRWKVTGDRTVARDDARITANPVADLFLGQVVEDRGTVVGDWRAVHLPDAIAYMHESTLNLPADLQAALAAAQARAETAARTWLAAQATYASFQERAKADKEAAISLDWAALSTQLDLVAVDHADAGTRIAAKRLKEAVNQVLVAANAVRKVRGLDEMAVVEHPRSATVATVSPPKTGSDQVSVKTDPTPVNVAVQQLASLAKYPAEGFVTQKDFPKVGVNEVLINDNGDVVAFLVIKPGSEVRLAEYYWRWVGVKGTVESVDPALHDLGKAIPKVVVEDVVLVSH